MCLNHKTSFACGHQRDIEGMFYPCTQESQTGANKVDCLNQKTEYLKSENACPLCHQDLQHLTEEKVRTLSPNTSARLELCINDLESYVQRLEVGDRFGKATVDVKWKETKEKDEAEFRKWQEDHRKDKNARRLERITNLGYIPYWELEKPDERSQ